MLTCCASAHVIHCRMYTSWCVCCPPTASFPVLAIICIVSVAYNQLTKYMDISSIKIWDEKRLIRLWVWSLRIFLDFRNLFSPFTVALSNTNNLETTKDKVMRFGEFFWIVVPIWHHAYLLTRAMKLWVGSNSQGQLCTSCSEWHALTHNTSV